MALPFRRRCSLSVEAAPRQFVEGAAFDNKGAIIGKPKAFRTAGRQSRFVHE
jgi:hypothetical protein